MALLGHGQSGQLVVPTTKFTLRIPSEVEHLSDKDMMFGILTCEDELFINHILMVAKQYLYSCRQNKFLPSIKVFNSKIKLIYQLETMIAKSNNKLKAHNMKWGKYKNN